MGVKWLKKETGNFKQRRREVGDVVIYCLSEQSVIIVNEKHIFPYYMLLQSWHIRNKKPFRAMLRTMSSRRDLTLIGAHIIANEYGISATYVTKESIPHSLRVS